MRYATLAFALVLAFSPLSSAFALSPISEPQLEAVEIGKESNVEALVRVELEPGYVLTADAPSRISLSIVDEPLPVLKGKISTPETRWVLTVPSELDHFDVRIEATLYFCQADKKAVCKIQKLKLTQPVRRIEALGKNLVPVTLKPQSS